MIETQTTWLAAVTRNVQVDADRCDVAAHFPTEEK